ncbi:hypothetical protein GJAV_G00256310, partial [Gymnothorax javanicus]
MWSGHSQPRHLANSTSPHGGQTYIMYHGTSRAAANQILANGFRQSATGMLGRGVYVSRDLQKASKYPQPPFSGERVVLKLSVNVGKVKRIDRKGHPMQYNWHDHGFDTAWCPPNCGMVPSGQEEDCVWDPKRIRVLEVLKPTAEPA